MILNFTLIKQIDICYVNYRCVIDLSSFDCIIYNDLNSCRFTLYLTPIWIETTILKKRNICKGKYIYKYIKIYITCSRLPPRLQKRGPHKGTEFAYFGFVNACQFAKYIVKRDSIFEIVTGMPTHRSTRWEAQPLTTLEGFNWPLTNKLCL